jgi:hypothetical protein
MQRYLLSQRERRLLDEYLLTGQKGAGFRLIKHRITKHYEDIAHDFRLIEQAKNSF